MAKAPGRTSGTCPRLSVRPPYEPNFVDDGMLRRMTALISPVLIGRQAELGALAQAFQRAAAGEPAVVLVGGEAGVGKTRLVEEAASRAAVSGVRVLTGACAELGSGGLPLAPLIDVLRTLARSTPRSELEALLGPARTELARLLPELDPEEQPEPAANGAQASRLFELVLGVVGRLAAEEPVGIVVEDLHWADRSTVDLIAFLVRAMRGVPVTVVGTYRSDEVHRDHPLRALLTSLERVRTVQRLELARFSRGEVAEQLEAILDAEPGAGLVNQVFERSDGNAFLVEEMLGIVQAGAPVDRLPPSLRDLLLARAERMPQPVRRILRAAAAAGSVVPEPLLAAVAGDPETDLLDALRQAVEHHLLVVDEAGYAFRHSLVRDAVYDDMLPGERTALHTAYGNALERDPSLAGADGAAVAALAHHWYAAQDLPRALVALVRAARNAKATYAPADAERHLDRALEIWPRVADAEERSGLDRLAVVELAVDAALSAGDERRALALIDDALTAVDTERQAARAALLLERRAQALRWMGVSGGLADLERAVDLLPAEPPSHELALVLASLGNSQLTHYEIAAARATAERAVSVARSVDDRRQEASALITLGSAHTYHAEPEYGLDALAEGVRVATAIGDHETALRGAINISDALELLGRHEEAADTAARGLAEARRVGLRRRYGVVLTYNLVEPLIHLGRWAEADRIAAEAAELDPLGTRSGGLYDLRGMIAVASGRLEDAARYVDLVRSRAEDLEVQEDAWIALLEAEVHLARGELAEARATVEPLVDSTQDFAARYAWPLVWLGMRAEADMATLARDRREPAGSGAGAAELVRYAADLPVFTPATRAYAVLVEAEHARFGGNLDRDAWQAAVRAWREAAEPYPLAYALLGLGEAEVAAGDRAAATETVREARDIAQGLGAEPLLERANSLARRARLGIETREPGPGEEPDAAPFDLTDRELEVLRLLAVGLSNREIGETLYMSPKTASVHVSRIFTKLGVSGRVEAAAIAHRHGLTEDSPLSR
jgi:DNA-binding CsgD family transcriptional regulator